MLSPQLLRAILTEASTYWIAEVQKPEIIQIAKGKEIGHKLADLVDEKTSALLTVKFLTKHECDARGNKRSRSMGDLWLHENGIYHPINVEVGIVGAEGQPNLVSLKKILTAIITRRVDSYYLLIVKMHIGPTQITPAVYLVDMLDWLDYVTFDSGPGQMMLKAVRFFAEYDPTRQPTLTIKDKVKRLMDLYEDGEQRLKANRERDLNRFRLEFETFMAASYSGVSPETQKGLCLE